MQLQVDDIRNITVIGSGLMGHGIAQEFAVAGYHVSLNDMSEERLATAMAHVERNLRMMAGAGVITEAQAIAAPDRMRTSVSLADAAADADVVIEAVFENLELKQRIFAELDHVCAPHTILASNSSSFMPSKLASATNRPDKVLVAHYFNPPHLLPLVELVRSEATSDETMETMYALYTRIGKQPAIIQKEAPGFVANRLQMAIFREALHIVEAGIASPEDIDLVIRSSIGRRWAVAGVFELLELIGTDLVLNVATEIMPDLASDPEPPRTLREMAERGDLGAKSGKGFYEWTPESAEALRLRIARALLEISRWSSDGA